jgi:hypothetical protein
MLFSRLFGKFAKAGFFNKKIVFEEVLSQLRIILTINFGKYGTTDTPSVPAAGENCGIGAAWTPLRAGSVGPASPLIFRKIRGETGAEAEQINFRRLLRTAEASCSTYLPQICHISFLYIDREEIPEKEG